MRLLLFLLFMALPLTACRRHTVIKPTPPAASANTLLPGMFITAAGDWRHQEKETTTTLVIKLRSNAVDWNYGVVIRRGKEYRGLIGNTGSLMQLSAGKDPWFIYVEAPDRLWFFDGKDSLSYGTYEGTNFRTDASIHPGGKLEPKSATIPAEIIPRLPVELQKLIPAPGTKRRPSI